MSDQAAAPAAPAASGDSSSEQGSDNSQQGEQGANDTQTKPAKPKPPSYRKVKLSDGQEVALSDDDIARDYSKWKGADAKFREADQAKKSVDAFMKRLSEDPEAVLNDPRLPLDRKKLAEKWLRQQIEEELAPKDPRDLRLKELEDRLKTSEEKEKADAEAKEQEARAVKVKASTERLGAVLKKAGELSHLSAHPESEAALIREMALYMRAAREQDVDVTAEQVVEAIHNQRFHQYYTLANQFEGEELLEFLGEAIVNKMRKADLARLKAKRDGGQQSHRAEVEPSSPERRRANRIDPLTARNMAKKLMG